MSSASVMLDKEEPRVRIDWLKGLEGSFMVCGACLLMPLMSYAKEPYYMGVSTQILFGFALLRHHEKNRRIKVR